ncbi:MAG: hypothetical protein OEY43_04845 [Gammaproteobacteria bacterium]|nr:hypothetical protein [Gammaproteobacteria bacterium]
MKKFLEDLNKYYSTPLIAIAGGLLGLYFMVIKDNLAIEASEIKNAVDRIDSELREREFSNALKIQMYQEVKAAISQNDPKLQNAVLLLVNELLADDPLFKDKLITVLLASPNTNEIVIKEQKAIEVKNREYLDKEVSKSVTERVTIDVFYLEDIMNEARPRAQAIVNVLSSEYPDYRIRLRLLPRAVNARSGYRIDENQIRFEQAEKALAIRLAALIKDKNIFQLEQLRLNEINPQKATPNYISMFVRNM